MRLILFIFWLPVLLNAQTEVSIHPTQVGLFGASTGSFLRAGASGAQWESASSLQGTLFLPTATSYGQVLQWNGTAWVPAFRFDSTFARGTVSAYSYTGKTLSNNLFRFGKNSFKTDDTTGMINVASRFGSSTPLIYVPDSSTIILKIKADSRGDSISNFLITRRWFDNSSEVGDNQVVLMGFNTNDGGGKEDPTQASMTLGWENKYDLLVDGVKRPMFEFHIPEVDLKSTGFRRPLSGVFGHEAAFGGAWGLTTDYLTINDYKTNTQKVIWGFSTGGYTKGIDFIDTAQLRFSVNNWNVFTQKKAGSGYVDVIKVDNLDQIKLGGGGESRVAAFNHFRVTNSGLITNENGELYIGNSTYPTRLLVEHNTSNIITVARTGAPYTNTMSIFGNQFYYQSSSGDTPWKVFLDAPSNSLLINSSGLVGVGTGSPTARLHVNSGSGVSTTKMLSLQNLAGTATMFRTNVEPEGNVTGNPSDFAFSDIAGAGKVSVKRIGSGNTGWAELLSNTAGAAGTASYIPKFSGASTLENSAAYDDGSNFVWPWSYGLKIQFSGSYNMGIHRGSGRNLELYAVSPDGDGDITLKPGGGIALTAAHAGNIGIGNTSPSYKLDVSGNMRLTTRSGTATKVAGWTSGDVSADFTMGAGMSISGGALTAANIYNSNGSLTAARTMTMADYSLTFDKTTAATTPTTTIIVNGATEASFTNRFFEYQDNGTQRFRMTGNSALISMVSGTRPIEISGSTYSRISSSAAYIQAESAGGIAINQLSSDPSGPSNGTFWYNLTSHKYKDRINGATKTRAYVEDDFTGSTLTVRTSNHTLSSTEFSVIYDANGGSFTVTLGSALMEGYDYVIKCRRNGTNTITFSAESGFTFDIDTVSTLTPTSLVVGSSGTGVQAPYKVYTVRRKDSNIFIQ